MIYLAYFTAGVSSRFYQFSSRQIFASATETVSGRTPLQSVQAVPHGKAHEGIAPSLDKRYDLKYFAGFFATATVVFFSPKIGKNGGLKLPGDVAWHFVLAPSLRGPPTLI
jgi:hypothetical protein